MLACTAMLVGCSDDDVLNNSELEKPQGEEMQAYLTFSIASSENSSRGVSDVNSGTTTGDIHNNPEHSGHENVGTPAENQINDIMVVFYNETKNEGFCGNYTINTNAETGAFESTTTASHNGVSTELTYDSSSKTYALNTPYTLKSTGTYKVLVVVNPNSKLKAKANASVTSTSAAKTIYEDIIKGQTSTISDIIGQTNEPNFMMTNRNVATIVVGPEHNKSDNPAGKNDNPIEVERVVSKITFRPTTYQGTDVPSKLAADNLYKIVSDNYNYKMDLQPKWLSNNDDDTTTPDKDETTYKLLMLYEAKIGQTTVWVRTTKNPDNNKVTTELYQSTGKVHDGTTSTGTYNNTEIVTLYTGENKDFRYVGTKVPASPATTNYFIKLTDYTLVNLNNAVYYVRHTCANTAPDDPALCYWGGIVSQTNYLIEPNTKTKSVIGWPATVDEAEECFGTTAINAITTAIGTDAGYSGFTLLPTTSDDIDDVTGTVTPENPNTGATATTPTADESTTVGNFMAYCFENNVAETNMTNKTTTGIIFKASIFDADGNLVKPMFKYEETFYPSLESLIYATGEGNSPFYALTDADYTNENITNDELLKMGITPYEDGACYYFSAEIKHHDDGAAEKKPMEYAIMRNNIYSLAVSDIKTFGFSSLNINDQIEDSTEETENLYMTLKARILPWIVRFNNVEF